MSTEIENQVITTTVETEAVSELIDEKTCKWFDLKPDRDLLDSNFDGYKLSLENIAKYSINLEQPNYNLIDICHHNEAKSGSKPLLYQHIKLFGFHNHLFQNEFLNIDINYKSTDFKSLYYFDAEWSLVKIEFNDHKRYLRKTNLKLEKNLTTFYNERVNITMKFIDRNLALLNDGCETIYLCELLPHSTNGTNGSNGNANGNHEKTNEFVEEKWKILFKYNLEQHNCINSVIKDATLVKNKTANNSSLNIILMNIQEQKEENNYNTMINYLKFENGNEDVGNWSFKLIKRINCYQTVPDYVNLIRNEDYLVIAGSSLIKFVGEDNDEAKSKVNTMKEEPKQQLYEWNESGSEVNVFIDLNEKNVSKDDINVNIHENELEVVYKSNMYLKDTFYSSVLKADSIWQLDSTKGIIEITLEKKQTPLMWSYLFKGGDKFGKYKLTETAKAAATSITQATELAGEAVNEKKIFNLNQDLEECDGVLNDEQGQQANADLIEAAIEANQETLITNEDFQMLMYLNLNTNKCVARSYINNNKYLFQLQVNSNKMPALCLRYDVDGILWQPEVVANKYLTHLHTFLAFGYVQASKQNAKFQLASPSYSYAVICDTIKHIYIYKQKCEHTETQLRNRKSGKTITHLAKQYVVTLDNTDKEIMGIYCSNEYIVILMENIVYFINANV